METYSANPVDGGGTNAVECAKSIQAKENSKAKPKEDNSKEDNFI